MSALFPSRRSLLGAAAILPLATVPVLATEAPSPDADLIRTCRQFAERQFDGWYRYVVAVTDEAAEEVDWPDDWDSYHWIVATPATTPDGWQAKALAYSAWHREAYDDDPTERDSRTTFLSSLLRDMVRPMRNAIIARLAAKYGPLPDSYTAEGIFIGYPDAPSRTVPAEPLASICPKAGPCPCDAPCRWGKQALADIRQHGWPTPPTAEQGAWA